MAKFDESKVINALHPEKAEVGKKYWYNDHLSFLKEDVEREECSHVLISIGDDSTFPFKMHNGYSFEFLYPYEEPPKKRMTNLMLMEWLSKGYGIIFHKEGSYISNSFLCYKKDELNNEVDKDILIHSWYSDDLIEPTVDIYERDCKGK